MLTISNKKKLIYMLKGMLAAACNLTVNTSTDDIGSTSSKCSRKQEIRKITPPNLKIENVGPAIYCYRPGRHGGPHLLIEEKHKKVIAHNYGHGSSGWTLAPGSATYIIDALTCQAAKWNLQKHTPIAIIGAGVVGLCTAYVLKKRGYSHIKIMAEKFDHLASHYAGGLFALPSTTQENIQHIGSSSYIFYNAIAQKAHPDFKEGARIIPAYFTNIRPNLRPFVDANIMQPPKNVTLDFNNGITRDMVAYDDSMFIEVEKMMTNLREFLEDKNKHVIFDQRKITSFADIDEKFICNCTGLGAIELNDDPAMFSNQGHLIMLKKQIPKNVQYIISVPMGKATTLSGQTVSRTFSFYPKHFRNTDVNDIGVIGGTLIKGATEVTPNDAEIAMVLKNAKLFFHGT